MIATNLGLGKIRIRPLKQIIRIATFFLKIKIFTK